MTGALAEPRCVVAGCTGKPVAELELVNGRPKKPTVRYRRQAHIYACAAHAADPELRRRFGRNWQGVLFT
jgi:hypothetical protein